MEPEATAPAITDAAPAVTIAPESAVAAVAPAPAPEEPAPEPPSQPARPPQTENGPWTIVVASERKESDTKAWVKRLSDAGFRVVTVAAKIGGTTWHRVALPGYRTKDEALAALPFAKAAAGARDGFLVRLKPGA